MSGIEITALAWAPPRFQGQVRDLCVRWALEEAALPCNIRLMTDEARETPAYRDWHPFGKVPAFTDGDLQIFESGAIVLHIAELGPGPGGTVLLPKDLRARVRAKAWIFAKARPAFQRSLGAQLADFARRAPATNNEVRS